MWVIILSIFFMYTLSRTNNQPVTTIHKRDNKKNIPDNTEWWTHFSCRWAHECGGAYGRSLRHSAAVSLLSRRTSRKACTLGVCVRRCFWDWLIVPQSFTITVKPNPWLAQWLEMIINNASRSAIINRKQLFIAPRVVIGSMRIPRSVSGRSCATWSNLFARFVVLLWSVWSVWIVNHWWDGRFHSSGHLVGSFHLFLPTWPSHDSWPRGARAGVITLGCDRFTTPLLSHLSYGRFWDTTWRSNNSRWRWLIWSNVWCAIELTRSAHVANKYLCENFQYIIIRIRAMPIGALGCRFSSFPQFCGLYIYVFIIYIHVSPSLLKYMHPNLFTGTFISATKSRSRINGPPPTRHWPSWSPY